MVELNRKIVTILFFIFPIIELVRHIILYNAFPFDLSFLYILIYWVSTSIIFYKFPSDAVKTLTASVIVFTSLNIGLATIYQDLHSLATVVRTILGSGLLFTMATKMDKSKPAILVSLLVVLLSPGLPLQSYNSKTIPLNSTSNKYLEFENKNIRSINFSSLFPFQQEESEITSQEEFKAILNRLKIENPNPGLPKSQPVVDSGINPKGQYPSNRYQSNVLEKIGFSSDSSFVTSSTLVGKYLQFLKKEKISSTKNVDGKEIIDPLIEYQNEIIDNIAQLQALQGVNKPINRQAQMLSIQEIEESLSDPELKDIMQEFIPINGLDLSKTHTVLSLNEFQMRAIQKEIPILSDGQLRVTLYGLNYQIYNLVDMSAKFSPPEKTAGSILELKKTWSINSLNSVILSIDQTRQAVLNEIRKRGIEPGLDISEDPKP